MRNFASLKYAELRKLAKNAGVKANLKHDKLVVELTHFYEKNADNASENSRKSSSKKTETKSAKSTPIQNSVQTAKANTPTSVPKTRTPVLVSKPKRPVPVPEPRTPLPLTNRLTTVPKPQTPAADSPVQQKTLSQGAAKPAQRWEKRVYSPMTAAKRTPPNSKAVSSPGNHVLPKRKQTDTSDISQVAKKNRNTFEKALTPNLASPEVNESSKRKRRSTFEKAPTPNLISPDIESPKQRRSGRQSVSLSPAVTEMLGAMKSDMNSAEMKQSLLSVLDKNVQTKVKVASAQGSTGIPRFAAYVKKRQEAKPITPGNKNWDKIHKKNFEKLDSIDVYLQKKRKRAEEMSASVKKARTLLSEVHTAVDKLNSHKTPETNENKFIKPRVSNANKTTPFKPTVLNTKRMNLEFGVKKSPKTLPRKSFKPVISSAVKKSPQPAARKSTCSTVPRKAATTPFQFNAVCTSALNYTVTSTKKKAFDLKASLARPITWKSHKGTLKPLEHSIKSPVYSKTQSTVKAKKDRAETRSKVAQRRADKKHNAQMARRGINM